jgi:hypothetical protein
MRQALTVCTTVGRYPICALTAPLALISAFSAEPHAIGHFCLTPRAETDSAPAHFFAKQYALGNRDCLRTESDLAHSFLPTRLIDLLVAVKFIALNKTRVGVLA